MDFHALGKWLIGAGLILALLGVVFSFLPKFSWVGHLPGDLTIKRDHFSFYFPLTTCLILSLVISLIARLLEK
jgi:hypothetical protein